MKQYSQGIMNDGPCILEDGEPLTPEEIVKKLNDKTFTIKLLMEGMDTISSGFADSKAETENYAEQKLIDLETMAL